MPCETEGSGWSGVSHRREALVHFTLNQDNCPRQRVYFERARVARTFG